MCTSNAQPPEQSSVFEISRDRAGLAASGGFITLTRPLILLVDSSTVRYSRDTPTTRVSALDPHVGPRINERHSYSSLDE